MGIHRDIWIKAFGEIPKDQYGRTYEIHHKDGNLSNNNIKNLECISIEEHFNTHLRQGDYGAATLIAKRMDLPIDYVSTIQKGKKRPELIGKCGPKKGNIPWNKGISGYNLKCDRKGKRCFSKLSQKNVDDIRKDFNNMVEIPNLDKIGINAKNGIPITYKTLFIEEYSRKYSMTRAAIRKILEFKTWNDGIIDARNKTK